MNALTARMSLDLLDLKPGQVLAVTGGPGAYGGYVIQLAKADGLQVIADCAEQTKHCFSLLAPISLLVAATVMRRKFATLSAGRRWPC